VFLLQAALPAFMPGCNLPDVALSSTKTEVTAAMTDPGKNALCMQSVLEEIALDQILPTMIILANNYGATQLSNAQQPTRRTCHAAMNKFTILQQTEEERIVHKETPSQFNCSGSLSSKNPWPPTLSSASTITS
jgi:hypothetical protein